MSGLYSNGTFQAMATRLQDPRLLSGLGARAVSLVQQNIRDGAWEPNAPLTRAIKGPGAKPLMDAGHLIASITYRVEGNKVIVWTARLGADIVHSGGTIKATKAKFLTIPAGRNTRRLMESYGLTPRACIEGMRKAGFDVFFRQAKGGKSGAVLYLPASAKKDAQPEVLFILKKEVKVPARPFLKLSDVSLATLGRYVLKAAAKLE